MNKSRSLWEARSRKYKTDLRGVLPKSFPRLVNGYIDDWMFSAVERNFPWKKNTLVLDIGCGYGRVAKKILKANKNSKVFGVDISRRYVDLFNSDLKPRGQAKVADARKLPFKNKQFDLAIIIGTLMYILDKKDRRRAFSEVSRVLKDGGRLILIEGNASGFWLFQIMASLKVLFSSPEDRIPLVNFSRREVAYHARESGMKIVNIQAMPALSLSLPFLWIMSFVSEPFLRFTLRVVGVLDRQLSFFLFPSIFVSYVLIKEAK